MIENFQSFPAIDLNDERDVKYAVRVETVTFGYKKNVPVLKNFTVRIKQGSIFALLGSNGCGKTTLLKLILGRAQPSTGWIRVFGLKPGSVESDIPGPGVGYMPQDIALSDEFTIRECLKYYGNTYKIHKTLIDHRIELLVDLLTLPDLDKRLNQLSGGQQRLVSLAVTIIHRPKLLILDEPTVGVDSILRCRIWSYLEKICKHYGTTVLITTHYIEEAKSADVVGFISTGSLLKQSNPYYLIQEYNCESLEEVFLILCKNHYKRLRESRKVKTQVSEVVRVPPEPEEEILADIKPKRVNNKGIDSQRMGALLTKSYIRLKRKPFVTLMFFFLPLIIITVFKQTVGTSPRHIPIAIEAGEDLDTKLMAQRLLNEFLPDQLRYEFFPTADEAIDSVVRGESMYALVFPANWSQSLLERMPSPFQVSEQTLNNSIVRIYIDHSNTIVAIFVRYTYIIDAVIRFLRKLVIDLDIELNPSSISLPIDVSQQIFPGSFLKSETYPSAGILVVVIYMISISLSAMVIIKELKGKTLERIYVSGVKPIEVFFVHLVEMFALSVIQSLLVTLLMHFLFDIPIDMTFFQSYSLILMHGIEGVGTGLLIALVFRDEIFAFIIVVGLVIPLMTCSAVIWPLEAIPLTYRWIAELTPITQPLDSLRSLLFRRLSISEPRVLIGFLVCLFYNLLIYSGNLLLVTYLKDFDFQNFFHLNLRG